MTNLCTRNLSTKLLAENQPQSFLTCTSFPYPHDQILDKKQQTGKVCFGSQSESTVLGHREENWAAGGKDTHSHPSGPGSGGRGRLVLSWLPPFYSARGPALASVGHL